MSGLGILEYVFTHIYKQIVLTSLFFWLFVYDSPTYTDFKPDFKPVSFESCETQQNMTHLWLKHSGRTGNPVSCVLCSNTDRPLATTVKMLWLMSDVATRK